MGERVSGDGVVLLPLDDGLFVAIVDVLGHGPEASQVVHVIEQFLNSHATSDVAGLMPRLHRHLRGMRGAAVGLCAIDANDARLDYVGIGNTGIRRFGASETRLVSQEGVVGQNMRTPLFQSIRLEAQDVIVLYTDGVSDRFSTGDYPAVLHHAPEEIVRNIVDRFGKAHDDSACIAIRFDG